MPNCLDRGYTPGWLSQFAVIGERAARYVRHAGWLKMMADVAEKLSLSDFSLLVRRTALLIKSISLVSLAWAFSQEYLFSISSVRFCHLFVVLHSMDLRFQVFVGLDIFALTHLARVFLSRWPSLWT